MQKSIVQRIASLKNVKKISASNDESKAKTIPPSDVKSNISNRAESIEVMSPRAIHECTRYTFSCGKISRFPSPTSNKHPRNFEKSRPATVPVKNPRKTVRETTVPAKLTKSRLTDAFEGLGKVLGVSLPRYPGQLAERSAVAQHFGRTTAHTRLHSATSSSATAASYAIWWLRACGGARLRDESLRRRRQSDEERDQMWPISISTLDRISRPGLPPAGRWLAMSNFHT